MVMSANISTSFAAKEAGFWSPWAWTARGGAAVPRGCLRLSIDSPVHPRYAGLNMVGNRPGFGVRNPVRSATPITLCVQKTPAPILLNPALHIPINHFPVTPISCLGRVSPVWLLEAAPQS